MSEQTNVERVRDMYESFTNGDLDAVLAGYSEDATLTWLGPADAPLAGTRRGHAGLRGWMESLGELVEFTRWDPSAFELVAQGDKVVVLGGEAGIVKGTGLTWDHEWVQVLTFRDGKIVEFRQFLEDTSIGTAFGV